MKFHDRPSDFFLRKLELHKLLELNISFVTFIYTVLPLFTLPIQDYLDLKQPVIYDTIFQFLNAYEQSMRGQLDSSTRAKSSLTIGRILHLPPSS